MNARATKWMMIAATGAMLAFATETQAKPHRGEVRSVNRSVDRIGRLITVLLTARDDDDREDAAERLGHIGGAKALGALNYAAQYDRDRGVRHKARKAAEQIRARLLAARRRLAPRVRRPRIMPLPIRRPMRVIRPWRPSPPRYRPIRRSQHGGRVGVSYRTGHWGFRVSF